MLRDVSQRSIATTVMGHNLSMPIAISPVAMQKMAHPEGECASVAGTIHAIAVTINYNNGSNNINTQGSAYD